MHKCSPLCFGHKPELFFYIRPGIGIKIRESTACATKSVTKSANEAWAIQKKCKCDNLASTQEKNEKYKQFLAGFLNKHGRLPRLVGENPYIEEYDGFSGIRRFWK